MIFVTGDTHSEVMPRLNTTAFPEQREMTKDDYVIILGDFGLVWDPTESKREKHDLDWLGSKPFTTLFVDGNHENYDRLYHEYEVENWNGGKVHKIRPSVIHLMRGQVFSLQGHKFFTFGGARSHDIDDGVYEKDDPKLKWLKEQERDGYFKRYRINHVSWWEEEMPSQEEFDEGMTNLAANNYKVDYILTHDMPESTLLLYSSLYGGFRPHPDELEKYLEEVRVKTEYRHWFCGHYHDERNITPTESVLYYQIVRIA